MSAATMKFVSFSKVAVTEKASKDVGRNSKSEILQTVDS